MIDDFVVGFLNKHKALIRSIARKYLIPNRYSIDDIISYITEKMLMTLKSRQDTENKILDKEKYFRRCLEYYCIEFQRQHGYIFELPKRPRRNAKEDELDIKSKGFKYLGDVVAEEADMLVHYDPLPGEEDVNVRLSESWHRLTGVLKPEDAAVIECIFSRGMTWPETSAHLNVAQSTCWSRKNRALRTIFGAFEGLSGEIKTNLKKFLRKDTQTLEDISN